MTKKLLQDFQSHTGIKHVGGECMAKAVEAVPFMIQPGSLERLFHNHPAGHVTYLLPAFAVKKIILRDIADSNPLLQGMKCVNIEVHDASLKIFFSKKKQDLLLRQDNIRHFYLQEFTNPHSGTQQQQD